MLYFLVFDALVLVAIHFHLFVLHSLGLRNESEAEIESISKAIERIVSIK